MDYSKNTITQAKDLVDTIKKLKLKENDTTRHTRYSEMYPPITKYSIVEKALKFFGKNLKQDEKTTTERGGGVLGRRPRHQSWFNRVGRDATAPRKRLLGELDAPEKRIATGSTTGLASNARPRGGRNFGGTPRSEKEDRCGTPRFAPRNESPQKHSLCATSRTPR